MELTDAFEATFPFRFDVFQRHGCEALEQGRSVLVCAPTGAGKTVVGEFAVWLGLQRKLKAFYTTPLKALSNQKFGDFIAEHGASNVGLLTGDNSINGDAPIVVMTTEVLRNMLYEGSPALRGLAYVVMDEVHYLKDPYRGAVWEEVLIHLPEDVHVAALSATVSNAEEFGDWLSTVRGDTDVVIEDRRPVPLEHRYLVRNRLVPTFVERDDHVIPNPALMRRSEPRGRRDDPRRRRPPRRAVADRPDVVDELGHEGLLPAIVFIFSRAGCDQAVRQCVAAGLELTSAEERAHIGEYVDLRAQVLRDDDLDVLGFSAWKDGLERGVAAHHAGLIPLFKETTEELFERGLIRVVFATETLSLGINMPAKSVVIERLVKWTGERHEMLTPSDYTQLTGRAGRRGIDPVGYGIVLEQPDIPFDRIAALAGARTYPLVSSFRPSYNMAANLLRSYNRDDAIRLLNLSFGQFLADRSVVRLERQIDENRRYLTSYRQHLTCERGDVREWWELERAAIGERRGRTRDLRRDRVAAMGETLDRLRPGQVLEFDRGRHRGYAVVLRRIGAGGVLAIDQRGNTVRVSASQWRHAPRIVGAIELPEGYRRTRGTTREILERLSRFTPDGTRKRRAPAAEVSDAERRALAHPVASCPDVAEHRRWAERVDRLERETAALEQKVGRRTSTLARTFTHVVEILELHGYVDGDHVTERGERLCRIYNESDLLAAEALERGVFEDLSPPQLAAVASTLVFDSRGIDADFSWPDEKVRRAFGSLMRIYKRVHEDEQQRAIDLVREPDPGFVEQAYWWAKDEPLEEVLSMSDRSAGDFVRSTKQVWDLLKQLADVAGGDEARRVFRQAADAVYRGVVAYSGGL